MSKMLFNFVSISQNSIEFRPNKHKEPYMKFKTYMLNYVCNDKANSCSAVEYLQLQKDSGINFELQHQIIKLNKILLKQLLNEDPSLCFVLEFQDPVIRSIISTFICTFKEVQYNKIQKAINNAFYQATKDADPINDFPLISINKEYFDVKIYDEGQVIKDTIIFQ